jgi:ureidoglycolate lyase
MRVRPLTAASFKAFGHVARSGEGAVKSIRADTVLLTKSPAVFEHDADAPDHALDFYDVQPAGETIRVVQAERHEHSAQMFIPMAVDRYLVIVWDADPRQGGEASAFLGGPEDIVIYQPGIWHHGIIAVGERGLFASTMWRTRGGRDVEFVDLPSPLVLSLESDAA